MINWVAVLIAYATTPTYIEVGLVRQGASYATSEECSAAARAANNKIAERIQSGNIRGFDLKAKTTNLALWHCVPFVP